MKLTGHVMRCRACVEELLVLALREREGAGSPQVRAEQSHPAVQAGGISREPHVSNAMALMRNNFRRVLPNEELAELVGLDAKYFIRLFRREVGLSPQRYYLRLRLEAAAHQMVHSRLSIQQIAEMFGFKSRSHFQNQFKKQFQSSPGVYRYYRRPAGK
ncbi:MAG: helix-turn-helix domain-containing protein [Phycisphaerales bacterium]